jgi:hypothetical protein
LHADLSVVNNPNLGKKVPEGDPCLQVSQNYLDLDFMPSPRTPSCVEVQGRELEDSELLWTKICRNMPGKHPRQKSPHE